MVFSTDIFQSTLKRNEDSSLEKHLGENGKKQLTQFLIRFLVAVSTPQSHVPQSTIVA